MATERVSLEQTLGRPELGRLLARLRTRLERGLPLTGSLVLSRATPEEQDAINRLLGRAPTKGSSISVPLNVMEEKLRAAGLCQTLTEAVERLSGPVRDLRGEQKALDARWTAVFEAVAPRVAARPELIDWLGALRAGGLLRRYGIEKSGVLLSQALAVLERLPANGIPLAELAAGTTGNAHALDAGRPLAAVVLRAVATLGGIERWDDSETRRDVWATAGVLMDELSAPVAVLNLRASDASPTSRCLGICADAGEPFFLSVRQLLRTPLVFDRAVTGPTVFVCENKNILAAAANRLGPTCAPLVCTDGQPKTALRLLLNRLAAGGIGLRYHGDFDWPGIAITNTILRRHAAVPWRMSAEDYVAVAGGDLLLEGAAVTPDWDADLRAAMEQNGRVVHEEQVFEILQADLRPEPPVA